MRFDLSPRSGDAAKRNRGAVTTVWLRGFLDSAVAASRLRLECEPFGVVIVAANLISFTLKPLLNMGLWL